MFTVSIKYESGTGASEWLYSSIACTVSQSASASGQLLFWHLLKATHAVYLYVSVRTVYPILFGQPSRQKPSEQPFKRPFDRQLKQICACVIEQAALTSARCATEMMCRGRGQITIDCRRKDAADSVQQCFVCPQNSQHSTAQFNLRHVHLLLWMFRPRKLRERCSEIGGCRWCAEQARERLSLATEVGGPRIFCERWAGGDRNPSLDVR